MGNENHPENLVIIEKEYEIILSDYIAFQLWYFQENRYSWNTANLASIVLSVFILFSLQYSSYNIIVLMGIIIVILNIVRFIIEGSFSQRKIKKYLMNEYYKGLKKTHVKIKIDDNSISEHCDASELKVSKSWVKRCIDVKDYIYLMDEKYFTLIMPKRFYSDEEQAFIVNNYKT